MILFHSTIIFPLILLMGCILLFKMGLSKLFKYNQKLGLMVSIILIIIIILMAKMS